jgi:hypothetical protein
MGPTTPAAEIVDKVGFYSFFVMTLLTVVCIAFGFFAVIQEFKQPTWAEACIKAGGVPTQNGPSNFDCKVL